MESLRIAGFTTRKAARKAFFTKVRVRQNYKTKKRNLPLLTE